MSLPPHSLEIRGVRITPPVALAPMVGLSHSAMRSLIASLGGAGLFFSEMLAAKHLPHESSQSPFTIRSPEESPLFYQISIADSRYAQAAAEKLAVIGADGIDINLGCPAPQVRRSGAGGFLVDSRDNVCGILRCIRNATALPLTAKIRLGTDLDGERLAGLCRLLEDEGVDLISVHARLHGEKFCRSPRWPWVAHAKKSVTIPVFVNGGIFSVADARRALDESGCDGVMLGRGGIENPYLFGDIAREIYGCQVHSPGLSRPELYLRFNDLLTLRFRPERRLGRLKQYTHYFASSYKFGHHLATAVQKSKTMEEALDVVKDFFQSNEPGFHSSLFPARRAS